MDQTTVMTHQGMALVYDPADVADLQISTPAPRNGEPARLALKIEFAPGKQARWINQETDKGE